MDSSPTRAKGAGDDDYEVRVAKEMAVAIQQNPKLTPAEIKELKQKTAESIQKSKSERSATMGGKSPLLKSISKGVKSGVKKASKAFHQVSDRKLGSGASSEVTRTSSPSALGGGGVSLGDFLDDSKRHQLEHSETDDTLGFTSASQALVGNSAAGQHPQSSSTSANIRITGIVWKRRSGLGKYSTTAWERRRVILRGSKLYYYQTNSDHKDEDNSAGSANPEDAIDTDDEHDAPKSNKSWLMEQVGHVTKSSSSKKDARGYLDLVKENAFVGASFGHSGAPTPFSLSIKVLAQTKWKLCFDTRAELMQWLAALTDVIVQASVDTYNSQILAANDPSAGDASYVGQLSEPPLIANSGTQSRVGGHRLWVGGHYKVQSEDYPANDLLDVTEGDLEDVHSDDDDENETAANSASRSGSKDGLVLELDGGREIWGIPAKHINTGFLLWNAAIIAARASSTTVEVFWYLLTFANFALFGLMAKETVGGQISPSTLNSRRMARRFSTGQSIPVASVKGGKDEKSGMTSSTPQLKKQASSMSDVLPVAGSTTMRIENAMDVPVNKDGHVFAGWRYANPHMMKIRSHNYKKDKIKVPSPGDLYECVCLDIFESRNRMPDMASRVKLPKCEWNDNSPKTWNAPDIFVVSISIPTDPPSLYNSSDDGGGYTVTAYFKMRPETRELLKKVTADGYNPKSDLGEGVDINKTKINAVRLLDEWCRRAPTDDAFCARFKVLPNAQNLKEIGLPAWISKYNGKPFLIKRPGQTGFIYRHPDKSCVEFDISLHPFPYLAKQGINFMKDTYFKKILVTFGFLIEGRAEDELPECLIGLMQLCYPDPVHALQGEDLMAGKTISSYD